MNTTCGSAIRRNACGVKTCTSLATPRCTLGFGASWKLSRRPNESPGYQPSLGRKLFMLGLCIVGLIIVWSVYLFNR
jgi:hypothetical protein